jgi:hypothetical protein
MKTCEVCGKEIPEVPIAKIFCSKKCYLKDYRASHLMHLKEYFKKRYIEHKDEIKDKVSKWQKDNPKRKLENNNRYRKRYPKRKICVGRLNDAIRYGKIKSKPCVVCGKKAHAHHENYDKPLKVIWLCPQHHKDIHKNGRNKKV